MALFIVVLLGAGFLSIIASGFAFTRSPAGDDRPVTKARITLAAIIAAVAVASVAYRLITGFGLQQSAALFLGIPLVRPSPRRLAR